MSSEHVDSVVGVIAIEPLSVEEHLRGAQVDCEATLGAFLVHLAGDGIGAREGIETTGLGCMVVTGDRFGGPARLSARLENLAAELELAVAQVRRKIAAARQSAA